MVDIGTNSVRLLIADDQSEDGRWVRVTGLGRGVDTSGSLSEDAMIRTVDVFEEFGSLMARNGVTHRKAIATSASRDASNREQFFDRAEKALGIRPTLVTGAEEARYAYQGAARRFTDDDPLVVTDIGGGSTEFATAEGYSSIKVGSVRLTEKILRDRPAPETQIGEAIHHVTELFSDVVLPEGAAHVGVAGSWTSLAAIALDLPVYDRRKVHCHVLTDADLDRVAKRLRLMTVEETALIPSLDPARATVILAGAVIATLVSELVGGARTIVSERDSLDGVAMELFAMA